MLPGTNIKVTRASELEQDYLTTGSKVLDEFLFGGIPTFGITEIVGEARTGKTQFCLQLALHAQLAKSENGLDGGCVYISTEQVFPTKRLNELKLHFIAKYRASLTSQPTDNIVLEHRGDTDSLLKYLEIGFEQLMQSNKLKKPPRLLILDSLAALFRGDYEMSEIKRRTADMRKLASKLHEISRRFNAAILVVNQVTASEDLGNIPSLGRAWRNFVTTRILITREDEPSSSRDDAEAEEVSIMGEEFSNCQRTLAIKFAPHVPNGSIPIVLSQEGIRAALPSFLRLESDD